MSFNFPSSPAEGAIYITPNGRQYVYTSGVWRMSSAQGVVKSLAAISDTPPASPDVGQIWWESDTGNLFVWYNDGDSAQWVQVNVSADIADHIQKTTPAMWAGFKSSPDRFVVNAQTDGLGSDLISIARDTAFLTSLGGAWFPSTVTVGASQSSGNRTIMSPVAGQLQQYTDATYGIACYNLAQSLYTLIGPGTLNVTGGHMNFQISGTTRMQLTSAGCLTVPAPPSGYTCNFTGASGGGVLCYNAGGTYGIVGYNNGSGSSYSYYGNTGALLAAGTWATSDERAKTNIETLDPQTALDAVNALRAVSYRFKLTDEDECGWIAQEALPLIPVAVHEDLIPEIDAKTRTAMGLPLEGEASMYTMKDKVMIATLWAAVQALSAQVAELRGG